MVQMLQQLQDHDSAVTEIKHALAERDENIERLQVELRFEPDIYLTELNLDLYYACILSGTGVRTWCFYTSDVMTRYLFTIKL